MADAVKIMTSLNEYERIVLAYHGENDEVHIAHSFFYNGRDGSKYLLFLYKDKLPKGNFVAEWNYLDETSTNITIVGEDNHEMAVNDFIACWDHSKTWKDVTYYQVKDFTEVDDVYDKLTINKGEAVGFLIK